MNIQVPPIPRPDQEGVPASSQPFLSVLNGNGHIRDPDLEPVAMRNVLFALTYGLELLRHGAMLVGADGHPYVINRSARSILDKSDGIYVTRAGLGTDRASDTRVLYRLLRNAMTLPRGVQPEGSPMALERKRSRSALIVRVDPGPELEWLPGRERHLALMRLYDRDEEVEVDERALTSLYGLTRGEATLAAKIVAGKTLEEAASELFISPLTARTHLKRIFMKTDTHRQPELVLRTLMSGF